MVRLDETHGWNVVGRRRLSLYPGPVPVVTELRRFPVKSCRGEELTEAVIEPWGLRGDRRWMLVDEAGELVSIRERRGMVLLHPEIAEDDAARRPGHLGRAGAAVRGRAHER